MNIIVIGAGMAGLLAARMLNQRGHKVLVLEAQSELPNNHNAVLRFRSNVVSDITGIPFKKVQMIKGTVPYLNPVAEALAYAYKTTGTYSTDRSIVQGLTVADRWIAPSDFISQLSKGTNIEFSSYQLQAFDIMKNKGREEEWDAIISTIPMPKMMELLNYTAFGAAQFEFKSKSGMVAKTNIKDCYAFATLYFPGDFDFYRASITGDELIIEYSDIYEYEINYDIGQAMENFGFDKNTANTYEAELGKGHHQIIKQPYAKIEPVDDKLRKRFMAWATDKHNVYSLGRYATWRPGLLLDDLVQDVKLIEGWIVNGNYEVRRSR